MSTTDTSSVDLVTEPSRPCADPLGRRTLLWLWLAATAVVFLQSPGLIVRDTELGVNMAPLQWIGTSLHLWNQSLFSGSVQIQQFGYLFPITPFFAIGQALHIPVWITERLWLSMLLTIAAWGIIRVAEALGIGRRWTRVLGAVAYCVAPLVIDWAALSVDLLAVAFLPWVLVPLIKGSREGSPRRAAARSGVAIALMGGVNAAVIFASLPLAIIWLLTRAPGPRRRALMGWWVVSGVLACSWWFGGAILQAKYGYDYLPYTETSIATTSTASLFEGLRGTSNWLNYYATNGVPTIGGGWTLVSSGVAIAGTAIVTGLGLAGLASKRIPERLFLVSGVVVGALVISSAYLGSLGGSAASHVISLLTSPFAVFRNVAKFSPDIALPVVLGLMWMVSTITPDLLADRPRSAQVGRRLRTGVSVLAVAGVLFAALPMVKGQLYPTGGFSRFPSYWSETATWLEQHQGRQTSMLVPGAPFATYTWGNPQDEPLSVLTSTSVTARSLIPLASNGHTQMLSTTEDILDSGTPQAGLAAFLSRSGIDYVVERNDLDLGATNAPAPAQVHQVLSQTPGLVQVASFGPYLSASQLASFGPSPRAAERGQGILPIFDSPRALRLRAVQIFKVVPSAQEVRTYPATTPVVVSGSSSSLVPLAGADVLHGRAAVLAADPAGRSASSQPGATWALTDGNQRRASIFGVVHANQSYLLQSGRFPPGTNQTLGTPLTFGSLRGASSQTTASPIGARGVSASSYGTVVSQRTAAVGPSSAFDGNPETHWVSNAAGNSEGQTVGIVLNKNVPVSRIRIEPLVDSSSRIRITSVRVSTVHGAVVSRLPAGNGPFWVKTAPGPTSYVYVTIVSARRGPGPVRAVTGAAITQITIPGVTYIPGVQLPTDELANFSAPGRPNPVISLSDPVINPNLNFANPISSPAPAARKVDLPRAMSASVTGTAVANPGRALTSLVSSVATPPSLVSVAASSMLRALPRFRAENLIETSSLPWIADYGDAHPTITLRWSGARSIGSIHLATTHDASRPLTIEVAGATGSRTITVPKDGGVIRFAPLVTDTLRLTILTSAVAFSSRPQGGTPASVTSDSLVPLPPGLASVTLPALGGTLVAPVAASTPLASSCGDGPTIELNGTAVPTAVTATVGQLLALQPVTYRACADGATSFTAGQNQIVFPPGGAFRMTTLLARPSEGWAPAPTTQRSARILSWGPAKRTVAMSAGTATYLQVSQSFNPGWVATLGGVTLRPISLEGWQQGWVVPHGAAGTVTMTFSPDTRFRFILLLGLVLLLVLALLALLGGPDAAEPVGERRPGPTWLLAGASILVMALLSTAGIFVVVPMLALAWRRRSTNLMALVAATSFIAAGVVVGISPNQTSSVSAGTFGVPAQLLSVIALSAVLSALVVAERVRPGSRSESGAGDRSEPT